MKTLRTIFLIAIFVPAFSFAVAQDGEQLFKSNCASCHALGRKLVGPDLIGVNERFQEDWLLKWIKSSQSLVKAGDTLAVRLFNENNKIPMTDAFISEEEIKAVLGFIKIKGAEMASAEATQLSSGNASVAASSDASVSSKTNVNLLNMFSFTEYLLLGLICILLFVIWILVRSIKLLSSQLNNTYNGQNYF